MEDHALQNINQNEQQKEDWVKERYEILFQLPRGGTYFFFKNIILNNAVISIFVGNAALVLILLFTTTIWTDQYLTTSDENFMLKMSGFAEQTKQHIHSGIIDRMVELNYTRLAMEVPLQNENEQDLIYQQKSFYELQQYDGDSYDINISLYWYKYQVQTYNDLEDTEKNQLLKIFTIYQFLEFQNLNEIEHIQYVFFKDTGLLIINKMSKDLHQNLLEFSLKFTQQDFCENIDVTCQQNQIACNHLNSECNSITPVAGDKSVNILESEEFKQNLGQPSYDFSIYNTAYSPNTVDFNICLKIQDNAQMCSQLDIQKIIKDQKMNIQPQRFTIIFSTEQMNIIYQNNPEIDTKEISLVIDYLKILADEWTESTYLNDRLEEGFQNLVLNKEQGFEDDSEDNFYKIYLDATDNYDSRNILVSLKILRLPHYFVESLTAEQRFNNMGIFFISGTEQYGIAITFFEIYAYLFFLYSSMEIIILMISFYILAYIHKITLIQIVLSINYHQSVFDKVGTVKYSQLDSELKQYQQLMVKRKIPSEMQGLSQNLSDFLWITEFLSKLKHRKQDVNLLFKGLDIYKRIGCPDGLEIVYNQLINEFIRQKNHKQAIIYTNDLINIHLNHMNYLNENQKGLESEHDDLLKGILFFINSFQKIKIKNNNFQLIFKYNHMFNQIIVFKNNMQQRGN